MSPRVSIVPDGPQLDLRADESILDGMMRLGFNPRHGCRRGGCGVCKVDVVSGATVLNGRVADSVLTPQERDCGVTLSCRAVPTTDLVVQLREERLIRWLPW